MNFLAHVYLSCNQEELLIGNFMADFIKNKDVASFSAAVQQGIQLHRKIDTYTDNHEMVKQGVRRLHPYHRKYSPVVVDVLYDYLLAKNWSQYSTDSLTKFTKSVYQILENHLAQMPEKLQDIVPRMIADDWLVGYSKLEGIDYTFERMKRRVSKPEHLDNVVESLQRDLPLLDQEFNQFFPDVIDYVQQECFC